MQVDLTKEELTEMIEAEMRRLYPNSRLEVWDVLYINRVDKRMEQDKNVDIVQIEYACGGEYMVEIVEKAEKEKPVDEMELARQIVGGK